MKYATRDDYEWEGVTDEQIKGLLNRHNCSLDGNRDEWIDRIFDCKKGLDMYNEATSANVNLEYAKASELYLEAAHLFQKVGNPIHTVKDSEGRGLFAKAMSMNPQSPEDHLKLADLYGKSAEAWNIAFGASSSSKPESEIAAEVNMRHAEGHKYSNLADAEVKRASSLPKNSSGKTKAEHFFSASEYLLSASSCHRVASEIALENKREGDYYTQLGIYLNRTAGSHLNYGIGHSSLENWEIALEEFSKAKDIDNKALKEFQKSLEKQNTKVLVTNLQIAEDDLIIVNKWIDYVLPKIKKVSTDTDKLSNSGDYPSLDIRLESIEGMIENLVSTVIVNLENTGSANANNVQMELQSSFIDGETNASLTQIIAGSSARKSFSILPSKAGKPNITLHISYSDPWGENYSNEIDAVIEVARREEERPPPATIINVKGDYIDDRDTIIQDSVVSRSNIGTGEKSKAEELREAKALLDDGIIDDAEFKQMKKEILGK